jgi:hypothetical protein
LLSFGGEALPSAMVGEKMHALPILPPPLVLAVASWGAFITWKKGRPSAEMPRTV